MSIMHTGTDFAPSLRYPDPSIEVLDERFRGLRLFSSSVERLATGLRWAEGPVWFGDGRYLLVSDIPNNRILRWDGSSGIPLPERCANVCLGGANNNRLFMASRHSMYALYVNTRGAV